MNFSQFVIFILILGIGFSGCSADSSEESINPDEDPVNPSDEPPAEGAILIFTKTEGFRHESIPDGVTAIRELASENGINTFHTEDATYFQSDSLAKFDAVLFLSTTGDILNQQQQNAFKQFIQDGGGFVGIHAATDTEYNWPWYGKLVGAYFESHPQVQEATITVTDSNHPSTTFLDDSWIRTDEWYNLRDINPDINVLLNLDESSYTGGENGDNHPIAWYHTYDGGRFFYTGGGHTIESYSEPLFRQHVWGGIEYVLN